MIATCIRELDLDTLPTTTGGGGGREETQVVFEGGSSIATEAALGVVSALLLLTLVGVVIGWVWSCRRSKPTANER